MTGYDPDQPSIDLVFPEEGDAIMLFANPEMHEDDGVLTPCAYLCPGMALEIGKRLIAWSVQCEDEMDDDESDAIGLDTPMDPNA